MSNPAPKSRLSAWRVRRPIRLPGRQTLLRDGLAGFVSALVTIAFCISFSALLFQGEIQSGLSIGLSALLTGSAVTGLIVALTTTMPPADAGPDTPAIAVLSVLAGTVSASVLAAGGSVELAIQHVLISITISTLLTGLFLFAIGSLKLGQILRFVPYPVIGGFLAASGYLLISGAIEVITGFSPQLANLDAMLTGPALSKLLVALVFAAGVIFARTRTDSFLALPLAFFGASLLVSLVLWRYGGSQSQQWFLGGTHALAPWWPLDIALSGDIEWAVFLHSAAEIGAVCGVTAIALLLDVSSLEVARARAADVDQEFRANGIANSLSAMVGGVAGNLSLQASILIEEAGAVSRASGVFAALTIGTVLLLGIDLTKLIPTPLLGGLLIYLGVVILTQALLRAPARRSLADLALALAIMAAIVWFGYLVGVMLGLVGSCLVFALNYSRIGVVRRHLTRADFSSNVDRSIEQAQILRDRGAGIHVFWLTGFIFFGSSNGVFEAVRRAIDAKTEQPIRFIILDFSGVTGFDTSAVLSLIKMRNYCDKNNVAMLLSGLSPTLQDTLEAARLFPEGQPHRVFSSRGDALEWCEERLLADDEAELLTTDDFEFWLASELGSDIEVAGKIARYFERQEIEAGSKLYEIGAAPDSIDVVATGRFAVLIADREGREVRIRVMSGRTVVGEMGFFRGSPRVASIIAEEPAVVYTMSRASFETMMQEAPEIGSAFMKFIIRTLSDRLAFANQEIAALL